MAVVVKRAVGEEEGFRCCKMKLSLVEKNKNKFVFEVSGVSPAYVNSLRRIFGSMVPTMAISKVEFKQNSSALYDEIIAHRLGLVVLKTDLTSYNVALPDAKSSPATHCTFKLKAVGPKTVYASDLKSSDSGIKPAHPGTIIVKLLEGQEIEFLATAHLGFGKDHSKWSPGLISYYYKPVLKVNNKASSFNSSKDKFPRIIFNNKGEIDVKKINSPQLVDACRGVDEAVVSVKYFENQSEFIFTIEPWGQLSPEEIVEEGIKRFNSQIDEFGALLKKV